MTDDAKTCECGKPVLWDYTCHTWPGSNTWMACLDCNSAILFHCPNYCWSYTWGLNPANPRVEQNEQHRPAWLVGDIEWDQHGIFALNMPAGVTDAYGYEGDDE